MLELSLPGFDYKVKKQNGTVMIFDIVRKKYVVLTPEEWVRQHVVHYLVEKKGYAISRVAVEREIELYGLKRRFDIVVFDRSGNPWLLVECKAPAVALTQKVFDQVFRYNLTLAAPYDSHYQWGSPFLRLYESGKRLLFSGRFPGIFPGEGTIGLIPYLYVNPIQVCLLLIEQAIREGICADDVVKLSVILNVIFF